MGFWSGFRPGDSNANDVVQLEAISLLPEPQPAPPLQPQPQPAAQHPAAEHHRLPQLQLSDGPRAPLTKLSQVFQSVRRE